MAYEKITEATLERLDTPDVLLEVGLSIIPGLKKKGSLYIALSPFRTEKTPSFVLTPSKMVWKDFGGSESGKSAISLIRKVEGLDFPTAVKRCCEITNIPYEVEETENNNELFYKEALKELNLFFINSLKDNKETIEYIKNRGISNESKEKFQLGYAPKWDTMIDFFNKSNYQEEYLSLKLFGKDKDTGKVYAKFYNRLMFPIFNHLNQLVGFSGRDLTGKNKAKYVNSNDSVVFKKSNILYGLNHVDLKKKKIILVEGQIDVILAHQNGLDITVASQGTAFTPLQFNLIKDNNILIAYDGDKAGQSATIKAIKLMLQIGKIPKVITLPKSNDVADILNTSGQQGFLEVIKKNISGIEYLVNTLKDSNPEITIKNIQEFKEFLVDLPQPIEEELNKEYLKVFKKDNIKIKPKYKKRVEMLSLDEKSIIKFAILNDEVDIIRLLEKIFNIRIDKNFLIKVVDEPDLSESEFLEILNEINNNFITKQIEDIKKNSSLSLQQKLITINQIKSKLNFYSY